VKQYIELIEDVLKNGIERGDRTGTGTLSVFGRTLRLKFFRL
jgi:thymidylate synthase